MILVFVAAVALGCLQQCEAELPAVGNCTFMEYYCTLREYETQFFKKLYKDPGADCGLQSWILYYRSLKKAKTCLSNSKKLEMANIKEIQLRYCSGFDLEIPLMSPLSSCSSTHKRQIDQCINDFATTFSNDKSNSSLCRKRGEAKLCTVMAWRANCNSTEIADGIYKKVIGDFNPFCSNDKDPWASKTDLCADYRIPYHPKSNCSTNNDKTTDKRNTTEDNSELSGNFPWPIPNDIPVGKIYHATEDNDNSGLKGLVIAGIVLMSILCIVFVLVLGRLYYYRYVYQR